MFSPEISPDIVNLALKAKALARRTNSRRNVVFLFGVIAGVCVAALWIFFSPVGVPQPQTKFVIGVMLGILAASLVLFLRQKFYFPKDANCPSCGYSWEIKEGRSVPFSERMEYWDKCPGCGLLMSDELLNLALTHDSSEPMQKAAQI